jgi:cytochrome c-type biogenesis protein CcmH/NrfG
MKLDSIAFALAGMVFGLLAGWVIGAQYATTRTVAPVAAAAPQTAPPPQAPAAAALDESKVAALREQADASPSSAAPRVALGNLYFDDERYDDAVKWYEEAIKLDARNPDVSTDLGVSYYYTNQPDRALAQFERSLEIDPKHTKTMLNMGIVRAFGKQDLDGATKAWEQVVALSPASPEGQAARRALDAMKNAHPSVTPAPGTD